MKSRTPMQKLKDNLEEMYLKHEAGTIERTYLCIAIEEVEAMLPEEERFAEKCFDAGIRFALEWKAAKELKTENVIHDFETFYKETYEQ